MRAEPDAGGALVLSLDDARWCGLRSALRHLAHAPAPGEHRVLTDGVLAGILATLDAEDRRARRAARAGRAAAVVGTLGATAGAVVLVRLRRLRP